MSNETPASPERRAHPRVDIPLLVELMHPTLPTTRCMVENISKSGVFVGISAPDLKIGSELKLKLLNTSAVEVEPTPTVSMRVERVEESGLALSYSNKSARHLWQTAERRRSQLAVGVDYFQVHVNLAVMVDRRMLLLLQRGHWVLPNFYLTVGDDWQTVAMNHLQQIVGLEAPVLDRLLAVDSLQVADLPESATLSLYQRVNVNDTHIALASKSQYSEHRWIRQASKLKELTIASANTGILLEQLLNPTAGDQDHDQ